MQLSTIFVITFGLMTWAAPLDTSGIFDDITPIPMLLLIYYQALDLRTGSEGQDIYKT